MEPRLKLVVGLGNPGRRYARTRHNAGFLVLDELLRRARQPVAWMQTEQAAGANAEFDSVGLALLKPLTFMNASGVPVARAMAALDAKPEQVFIVCDCLDLPLGRLRIRAGGSSGGHRGVASVENELQTREFPRLRFGIGKPAPGDDTIDFVLGEWTTQEQPTVRQVVEAAADAVLLAAHSGLDQAMNRWNGAVIGDTAQPGSEKQGDEN